MSNRATDARRPLEGVYVVESVGTSTGEFAGFLIDGTRVKSGDRLLVEKSGSAPSGNANCRE